MGDVSTIVFDLLLERHVALKEEWLSNVFDFIESHLKGCGLRNVLLDPARVAGLVFEQWKYADIGDSTYPFLKQLGISESSEKVFLQQPVVLQINSIVDIGAPFHSQLNSLTYEFVDNTGFEVLPELERGQGPDHIVAKARRMLSLSVTDGDTNLRAIEYRSIKNLSLLTPPGSKILLIPPVLCRKGVLFLTPDNFQLLGGDVEKYFASGRPLQVMASKLNATLPASKHENCGIPFEMPKPSISAPIPDDDEHEAILSNGDENAAVEDEDVEEHFSESASEVIHPMKPVEPRKSIEKRDRCNLPSIELEDLPPNFEAELEQLKATPSTSTGSSEDKLRRDAKTSNKRVIRSVVETPSTTRIESLTDIYSTGTPAAPTSSILELCGSQQERSFIKAKSRVSFDPGRRPVKLGIQSFLTSPPQREPNHVEEKQIPIETVPKKIKIEMVDLTDEEDMKPNTSSADISASSSFNQTRRESLDTTGATEDELVVKFKSLNVVRLADASKQMRFAVGSCRKTVQPIILDIIDPLRIVDGTWTMKVALQDDSVDRFQCLVDNRTLTSLIGLTPAEAMEVRNSEELERRRDGQRRLAAVEEQLKRLDLIIEVEMYSSRADAVIRNIRTFMQALDVL
ncbi:unnamed protein product [Nippostrongylus brasiliensis]|uniref:RecQ-mediated genome instability protein 1 n=1 Tax=Nippostrongylus brasiliensis TaxID=27835 RepID=A0A0N4Y0W4_NIPBR|nr:unnamed protein product [Nippostrongylus brasiliensis]